MGETTQNGWHATVAGVRCGVVRRHHDDRCPWEAQVWTSVSVRFDESFGTMEEARTWAIELATAWGERRALRTRVRELEHAMKQYAIAKEAWSGMGDAPCAPSADARAQADSLLQESYLALRRLVLDDEFAEGVARAVREQVKAEAAERELLQRVDAFLNKEP